MFNPQPSHNRRAFGMESSPVVLKRQRVQPFDASSFEIINNYEARHQCHLKPTTAPVHNCHDLKTPSSFSTIHDPESSQSSTSTSASLPSSSSNSASAFGCQHSCPVPSAPVQTVAQQPWWLKHPKTKLTPKPNTPHCYYCEQLENFAACERCERTLCEMCTRFCDSCSEAWCSCCTVVDYDSPFDPTLCLECYDERRANEPSSEPGNMMDISTQV